MTDHTQADLEAARQRLKRLMWELSLAAELLLLTSRDGPSSPKARAFAADVLSRAKPVLEEK